MCYLRKPQKNVRLIVCDQDNKTYLWCTDCNKNTEEATIQCVKCTRWVHQNCSKMLNKS